MQIRIASHFSRALCMPRALNTARVPYVGAYADPCRTAARVCTVLETSRPCACLFVVRGTRASVTVKVEVRTGL